MAKIELSNISHTYNPNDTNPTYALNPFSMTWENGKRYAICLLYTSDAADE